MRKNIRTDLAIEAAEIFKQEEQKVALQEHETLPPGVEVENSGDLEIKVTRVKITSPTGEAAIGKPMGNYITIEVQRLKENDQALFEKTCKAMSEELMRIVDIDKEAVVLVVGLGNWNVTPDALGPKVVSSMMVTRHLFEYMPEKLENGLRPVCAVAPGVLGITGIETGEIVKGIVEKVKPALVIAVDALASRKLDRVSTTIQLADTGISPGSGVGNKRMELSKETLGVPVIAIGIPTVVDAATVANDTIDLVLDNMIEESPQGGEFYKMLGSIDRDEKYKLIQDVLKPFEGNLIVTPKEVDDIIEKVSKVVANGINIALHQGITQQDVNRYVH